LQKKKKRIKPKKGVVNTKAKRKTSVARAVANKGKGSVKINKRPLETVTPRYVMMMMEEPLLVAPEAGKDIDIEVDVKGGGVMAQAVAARAAIAKAIAEFGDEKTRRKLLDYDRLLLVDDVRRVEPKKPLGPKARKKKQKSKR
jgi:small subunit ribosomal protein S9